MLYYYINETIFFQDQKKKKKYLSFCFSKDLLASSPYRVLVSSSWFFFGMAPYFSFPSPKLEGHHLFYIAEIADQKMSLENSRFEAIKSTWSERNEKMIINWSTCISL